MLRSFCCSLTVLGLGEDCKVLSPHIHHVTLSTPDSIRGPRPPSALRSHTPARGRGQRAEPSFLKNPHVLTLASHLTLVCLPNQEISVSSWGQGSLNLTPIYSPNHFVLFVLPVLWFLFSLNFSLFYLLTLFVFF